MNALVTGGTKGIGFAIAEAMLAAGGNVMITGRDEGRVKQALTALTKSCAPGAQLIGAAVDVRNREGLEAAIDRAAATFGNTQWITNSAAATPRYGVHGAACAAPLAFLGQLLDACGFPGVLGLHLGGI